MIPVAVPMVVRASWGARLNAVLFALAALVSLAWLFAVGRHGWTPLLVPLALVLWAHQVSSILLVEELYLRVRWRLGQQVTTRPVVALPPPLGRWSGARAVPLVAGAIVVVVTALREGALAPDFVLTINWWDASTHWDANHSASSNWTTFDKAPQPRLAGRYLSCDVDCTSRSVACESFARELACDDRRGPPQPGALMAQVHVQMRLEDAACYTPLYKSAGVDANGDVHLGLSDPNAQATHSLRMSIHLDQTVTGLASCRTFNEQLGVEMARTVAGRLQEYVSAN